MKLLLSFIFILISFQISFADSTTWVQKANMEAVARHRCNDFTIGHKGYFGLGHHNSVAGVNNVFSDFWEYDPATDSWTQKADYGQGQIYHAFDFVIDNKAYVGCGRSSGGTQFRAMWMFDPIANTWTKKADFPGSARSGPKAFVINGIAYAGSGIANSGSDDNAFYAYNPVSDSWTQKATFPGTQRNDAVAFSIQQTGYYGTGFGDLGSSREFWAYNPQTNTWTQKADVGTINRGAAIGFVINDLGYIMSGVGSGMDYNDVWEYNPSADTWVQIGDFPGTKRHFMASFVINNKAYCGSGTSGINFNDLWVFNSKFKSSNKRNYDANVTYDYSGEKIYIKRDKDLVVDDIGNPLTLKILDSDAVELKFFPFQGKVTAFDYTDLTEGIYFYQIHSDQKMLQYGRFEIL
jgi:N-acetylneuraminic acid mutarotase